MFKLCIKITNLLNLLALAFSSQKNNFFLEWLWPFVLFQINVSLNFVLIPLRSNDWPIS